MPFGGLAPLPLRLGGTQQDGLSPEEHARLSIDVASGMQLNPLIVMTVSVGGLGETSVTGYLGRNGTEATGIFVTYTSGPPSSSLAIAIPETFTPPGSKKARPWRVTFNRGEVVGNTAVMSLPVTAGNTVEGECPPAPFVATIEFYGDVEEADPHDYGTDEDKTSSLTEGDAPYAYWQLQEIIRDRGSAFTTADNSLVMIENLAMARAWALVYRIAERHAANQTPATAGQAIYRWARIMGVQRGQDEEWQLRHRCVNKQAFRLTGANVHRLDAALRQLMGTSFVGIVYHDGTLANPPVPTFWPVINPGPAALDLGDGTWCSDRARFTVQLQHVPGVSDGVIAQRANTEMFNLLDGARPATATWDWSFDTDEGFLLGTAILGRNSL